MNRGDIYWVQLDPTTGSEIKKKRPCVIVTANPINKARRTVVVVPLSSAGVVSPPVTVEVLCQQRKVVAVIDQVRAVDKSRFDHFIETMPTPSLHHIEAALKHVLVLQ